MLSLLNNQPTEAIVSKPDSLPGMESFPKVEQECCLLPSLPQALSYLLNGNANFRLKDFFLRKKQNTAPSAALYQRVGCFFPLFPVLLGLSIKMFRSKYRKGLNDREVIVLTYFSLVKVIIIQTYNFWCQVSDSLTVNNVNKINFSSQNVLSLLQEGNLIEAQDKCQFKWPGLEREEFLCPCANISHIQWHIDSNMRNFKIFPSPQYLVQYK